MSNQQKNNKRAFILVMIALSFIVLIFAYFYYKNINSAKDPRVTHARELYKNYNELAAQNAYNKLFTLLDSIENIYVKVDHYKESFEVGVLYNNRAAAYLTMALYDNKPDNFINISKDSLLELSKTNILKSIRIYENWLNNFENKNQQEIKNLLSLNYFDGLEKYDNKEKYLDNRIKEIETAQYETKRRLSVAYTNLGIINRHFEEYEKAINNYQKAIKLWDQNLDAENSLNILLGKPLKKRNLIQKLFPPKRKED